MNAHPLDRRALPTKRSYLIVGAVLLLLTATTIGLAYVDLHGWNAAVGLGIAAVKVALVAAMFMDLRTGPALPRLVAVGALLWLTILLVGTLDDVLTRVWLPAPGR